jgi:tRNA U34 5-methylaminomethyl-2-thiouridine-forming methyltransferase MnmC
MQNRNQTPLDAWTREGFSDQEAAAWLTAAPARFTPYTARAWQREGFGPADAALWSEVFADPITARARRNAGYLTPWDEDVAPPTSSAQ